MGIFYKRIIIIIISSLISISMAFGEDFENDDFDEEFNAEE